MFFSRTVGKDDKKPLKALFVNILLYENSTCYVVYLVTY